MKSAIIIGASSGIGRELALQLGKAGFRLGLMARNAQALEEVSRQSASSCCFWRACDISETDKALLGISAESDLCQIIINEKIQ